VILLFFGGGQGLNPDLAYIMLLPTELSSRYER